MSIYTLVLFLHIVGALGLAVALAFEWIGWSRLRAALTIGEAHGWLSLLGRSRIVGGGSLALIVLPGLYLATSASWPAWTLVALATIPLLAALGFLGTGRGYPAIAREVRGASVISEKARAIAQRPIITLSLRVRVAIVLAIVFVMTAKPDLVTAILVIAVAAIVGAASVLVGAGRGPRGAYARAE